MSQSTRTFLCAAAIFLLSALLCFALLTGGHDWGDDFAQYLSQGEALFDGTIDEWLAANRFIVSHSPDEMAVSLYPWGYPLLLTAVGRIFGTGVLTYKILQAVLLALSAALFYLLCRRLLRPFSAFVAGVVLGVGYALLQYVNCILSEPLFLVLTLLFFLLLERFIADAKRCIGDGILLGAVAFLAFLTRSQGVNLLLALIGYQFIAFLVLRFSKRTDGFAFRIPADLFTGRKRWISHVLPYAVFALLLFASKLVLPQNPDSSLYFLAHATIQTFTDNLLYYCRALVGFFPLPHAIALALCLVCTALAVFGAFARRDRSLPLLLFIAVTFFESAVFPWTQGIRYLAPAWPAFLVYVLYGAEALSDRVRLPRACIVSLGLAFCCLFGYQSARQGASNLLRGRPYDAGAYTKDAQDTFRYIREETPEDAVIVFFKPRLLYMETHRLCYREDSAPANLTDADYFLYTTDYGEIDFSLLEQNIAAYQHAGHAFSLEPVYENSRFFLYRIVTDRSR